jgi:hypothetical protein
VLLATTIFELLAAPALAPLVKSSPARSHKGIVLTTLGFSLYKIVDVWVVVDIGRSLGNAIHKPGPARGKKFSSRTIVSLIVRG